MEPLGAGVGAVTFGAFRCGISTGVVLMPDLLGTGDLLASQVMQPVEWLKPLAISAQQRPNQHSYRLILVV